MIEKCKEYLKRNFSNSPKAKILLCAIVTVVIALSVASLRKTVTLVVDGNEVKMEVEVGDKVIYSKYAGNEVKIDGEEYIILRQSDILAVIE